MVSHGKHNADRRSYDFDLRIYVLRWRDLGRLDWLLPWAKRRWRQG